MKIVVDTNILISTIMSSDGVIGTFLLKDLREIEKYSCYYLGAVLFTGDKKLYKGLKKKGFLDVVNLEDLKLRIEK